MPNNIIKECIEQQIYSKTLTARTRIHGSHGCICRGVCKCHQPRRISRKHDANPLVLCDMSNYRPAIDQIQWIKRVTNKMLHGFNWLYKLKKKKPEWNANSDSMDAIITRIFYISARCVPSMRPCHRSVAEAVRNYSLRNIHVWDAFLDIISAIIIWQTNWFLVLENITQQPYACTSTDNQVWPTNRNEMRRQIHSCVYVCVCVCGREEPFGMALVVCVMCVRHISGYRMSPYWSRRVASGFKPYRVINTEFIFLIFFSAFALFEVPKSNNSIYF